MLITENTQFSDAFYQATKLLQSEPYPDDLVEQIEKLSDEAPESEDRIFGDLIEAAISAAGA